MEENGIMTEKLMEKQRDLDAAKSSNVNFEHQVETMQKQLETLERRLEDSEREKNDTEEENSVGVAERKHLEERIEQAEDRAATVIIPLPKPLFNETFK